MSVTQSVRKIAKATLPLRLHPIMFSLRRQWARSRKRQAELGPYATAVLTETEHGKLLVPAADMEVGRILAHGGNYGFAEVEYHLNYLTPASRILVVGTHVGALLVPLAKHVQSVVGIEANPDTIRLLKMNLLLNGLDNVQLHNIAAGDRNGEVEFLMRRCNTGASAIVAGDLADGKPWASFDEPKTVKIPVRRLDDLLAEDGFDLIIMDIEGAEYRALQGMEKIVAGSRRLQVEVIPYALTSRGGVTGEQFGDLLAKHFPQGRLLDWREPRHRWQPTQELIRSIFGHGMGCDALFAKPS